MLNKGFYLFREPNNCFGRASQGQLSKCNQRKAVIAFENTSHKGLKEKEAFLKCSRKNKRLNNFIKVTEKNLCGREEFMSNFLSCNLQV